MMRCRHYLKRFKTSRLDVPSGPSREALDKGIECAFHRDRRVTDQRLYELSYLNGQTR